MSRVLHVWFHAHPVGHLSQGDDGRLAFAYEPAWIADPRASPLSQSLPLRATPFDERECRPFFAGLLPEERARAAIARNLHVSEENDFALLNELGGECAGAVSLIPPGSAPARPTGRYLPLDEEALVRLIAQLPKRPLLAGQEGVRISLAGAQGKIAVRKQGDLYALPLDGSPSTHILKPRIPDLPESVQNEAFCMRLAAKAGIGVAPVEIRTLEGGERILEVGRYDRRVGPGHAITRLHQEDFCQALGVLPRLKYEAEGGPSLRTCFSLVRDRTTSPGAGILRLVEVVAFNALIGNGDAHAKNFSLLYDGASVALSPFYDLLSTAVYPELDRKMAMKIGRTHTFEKATAEDWAQLAVDAGLAVATFRKRVLELAERLPGLARDVLDGMERDGDETAVAGAIKTELTRRCRRLQRVLGEGIEADWSGGDRRVPSGLGPARKDTKDRSRRSDQISRDGGADFERADACQGSHDSLRTISSSPLVANSIRAQVLTEATEPPEVLVRFSSANRTSPGSRSTPRSFSRTCTGAASRAFRSSRPRSSPRRASRSTVRPTRE